MSEMILNSLEKLTSVSFRVNEHFCKWLLWECCPPHNSMFSVQKWCWHYYVPPFLSFKSYCLSQWWWVICLPWKYNGTSYICCIFLRTEHELMLPVMNNVNRMWLFVIKADYQFISVYPVSCTEKRYIQDTLICCYICSYFSTIKICAFTLLA